MRALSEMALDTLYKAEPILKIEYALYFAATSMPASPAKGGAERIEIRIPSEQLHIEVLQRLKKYVD